jgi:ribose 5-phosphate isomerase B
VDETTMEHRIIRPVAWAKSSVRKRVMLFFVFLGEIRYTKTIDKFRQEAVTRRNIRMKIAIGADHAGYRLKEELVPFIQSLGHEIEDFGCNCDQSVDYPDYALPVCDNVSAGQADRGILICGTGIGMSIAANKVPGIRCALVHDMFSAKATREHNDTNVLAMGERVIGPGIAQEIIRIWLETPFSNGERHAGRVGKVMQLESKYATHP